MTASGAPDGHLGGFIQRVLDAETLDDALADIADELLDRYALWRVGVWRFIGQDAVRLEALWSVGDSSFEVGLVVNLSLTSDVEFLAANVLRGQPTMFRTRERDLGLLTDMLRREGVGSIVLAPLGGPSRQPVALLALASSRSDVFSDEDIRFVRSFADGIGVRVLELLEAEPRDDG